MKKHIALFIALSFMGLPMSYAQINPVKSNHPLEVIRQLGSAAAFNLKGGSAYGYCLAVEATPIENKLELEAGYTRLFASRSWETDIDLLFKKPWTISSKLEFMAGIGPEFGHENNNGAIKNSLNGETALDFMCWPFATRRFGWFWSLLTITVLPAVMNNPSASAAAC